MPGTTGTAVRRLRTEKGLSLEQLAVKAGTSVATLSRLELAGSVPKLSIFERIAAELGTDASSLLSGVS